LVGGSRKPGSIPCQPRFPGGGWVSTVAKQGPGGLRPPRGHTQGMQNAECRMENARSCLQATPRLPRGHPQAIWWPTGRHPEATQRATQRLPSGYPQAILRLPPWTRASDGLMPVNGQPNQRGFSVSHWHSGTSVSSCCGRPIIVSRLPAMPSLTVPVARSGLAIVSP
jgi:hypothetical protein